MKPVKCPNCGNEIAIDESSQYLTCGSCGKCYVNPYYVKKESTSVVEQSNQEEQNEKPKGSWRCVSCKAILPSDDSSPTLTCPVCGRNHKNPSYKSLQPAVVQDSTTKTVTNVQENTKQKNKDDIHVISWAYCPQCGNSLDLKNGRTEAYCDHCKKTFVVKRTQDGAIHLEEKKQTVNVQQNIVNIQQNIVTAPAKVGESKFTGTYGSLLGNRIVNSLISIFTLGFGIPWVICRSYRWEVDHTVIDGRRLKFDGTGGKLIGSWIKWMFLTLITCGIYGLWVPLKKRAWIVEHSHIEGLAGESKFTGGLASFLGLQIVNFFILIFTLGLGVPWVVCRSMKWDSEHQIIDGRRIYFDGNAAQLFGNWIKWVLLTVVTLGIYSILIPIKKQAWIVKHQSFVKPVGNSGQSTGKLVDVNGQKKKDIGKIVGCVLAAACVIAVIVVVCVTVIIPNIPGRSSGGSGNSINGGTEDGIIEIKGGTVDGNKVTLSVSPSVDSVDLFGKITLSEGFSWQLYADYACETRIPTQMAESLDDGVNLYYIVVVSSDGRTKRTYTLSIFKNYYTDIYFYSDSGVLLDTWTNVLSQTTLNDHSDINYQGYTYSDFNCEDWCVTQKDKCFYAGMATPNTYTITLNPNGGSVSSKTKQVTYDDAFILEVPTRTGYTFSGWYDGDAKVTSNTGKSREDYLYTYDKTLTAEWKINEYKVTLNTSGGGGTVSGAGKYDYNSRVTITATTNAGYTWLGWYDGTTKVSENLTYTFTIPTENKTYTAKWSKVTLAITPTEAGSVTSLTGQYNVGDEVTITATTNSGYTWLGWYDGNTKVSEGNSMTYTFTMSAENKTYTAKWMECPITLEKNIPGAGTVSFDRPTALGAQTTIIATTNSGYTWLGWYDGDTKVSGGTSLTYTFTMSTESKTYTAKWIECPVTLEKNIPEAGTVSFYRPTVLGAQTTIIATTNPGYTWLGWYDGDTKVSEGTSLTYTFTVSAESKIYTAKWACYTVSTETNLEGAGSYTNYTEKKVVFGETVELVATTNPGYTWLGWYDGGVKVSEGTSLTYTFTMPAGGKIYTAKWACYTVSTETNLEWAGSYTNYTEEKVPAGKTIELGATTNPGYTWLGWYDGETLVCEDTTYTFTMPAESKTYTAKWACYTVSTETNLEGAGSYTHYTEKKVAFGEAVELVATTNPGYTWLGWYDGGALVCEYTSYTLTMPAESKIYTAKWAEYYVTVEKNMDDAGDAYRDGVKIGGGSITFNLNGGSGTAPATQSHGTATYPSIPTRSGYVFAGWYDNQQCTGSPYDFTDVVSGDITLYAKWISYSGTGVLTLNSSQSISVVSRSNSTAYYAFVPLTDGQVTIYTTGDLDTYGYLYNSSKSQLTYDDDSAGNYNFKITYNVTAGTLYYVRPCGYSRSGTTTIHLEGALPEDGGMLGSSLRMMAAGETVELTATTNPGYTWLGWYDGDTKVSEDLTYTFTMSAENKTYTAKWTYYTVSTDTNLDGAGTYTVKTEERVTVGETVELTSTTNPGYTWLGWYDGDTKVSEGTSLTYTFTMPAESKTYTAKWACYTITTETNLEEAGTYTIKTDEKVVVGETVELTAITKAGYTWLGWYDGDTKVSEDLIYAFTMTTESKTYTAKWMKCSVTLEKNIAGAGTVIGVEGATALGAETTITATTNAGYTWLGWYDGDTKVSEGTSLTYTFTMTTESKTYTAKWSKVTIESNNSSAGTVSSLNDKTYVDGEEVIVTATTNPGYTWLGWYDGDAKVSEGTNLTYAFTMPAENKTYIAKWMECPVTLEQNIAEAGTVSGVETTAVGGETTITATTNLGYTWFGWYYGDTLVSDDTTYTFTMSSESKIYTAKWEINAEMQNFYFTSTETTCTITGIKDEDVTSIVIPSIVTSIGDDAFYECDSLTSITIPDSVTSIGDDAFYGCSSLTKVEITDLASWCNITFDYGVPPYSNPLYYAQHLYLDGEEITELVIPDSVTSIGDFAFYGFRSLTSVTFGENSQLTSIGNRAFVGADFTSVDIPDSVTSIGISAFEQCRNLKSVTLGENSQLTTIGYGAFEHCTSLTSVVIPASVTSIGDDAFNDCDSITKVEITDLASWCNINFGDNPLWYAKHLYLDGEEITELVIPDDVTTIGDGAFMRCESLTEIFMPASVTTIGRETFFGCTSLTDVTFGENSQLTTIGYYAFGYCSNLTSVTFGENSQLAAIGNYAFRYCYSLTSITIPANVTTIGNYAFDGCFAFAEVYNYSSLDITKGNKDHGYVAYYALDVYTTDEPSKLTTDEDGFVLHTNEDVVTLVRYIGTATEITIPASVTTIGSYSFYSCSGLTRVTFEENSQLTTIGDDAFQYCYSLTSITIPASVTTIGKWAFSSCTSLTSVTFEDPNGWCVTQAYGSTSGISLTLTNTSTNATYLKSTYDDYYWYKL